jgi:hypothetical protein
VGGEAIVTGSVRSTVRAFAASVLTTGRLLVGGRLRSPRSHVGRRVVFADGSDFRVYRETAATAPCRHRSVLVVRFRLRLVGRNRLAHAAFRAESVLNTPLFAGFPGFRTKLWLTDARTGEYRGLYDWDGPDRAEAYATTLLALLRLICAPGSLAAHVEPEVTRDIYLRASSVSGDGDGDGGRGGDWWAAAGRARRV